MKSLQDLRNKIEGLKGQRSRVQQRISQLEREIEENTINLNHHEEAKIIIYAVALKTQEQLQYHISDIISLALDSIFPNPYTLEVEFVQRRNKTECDLYFVRDGERIEPKEASGVGAMDVASFALRVASWTMMKPRSRNTLILDEPFRCLSKNFHAQASSVIKQLSEKLKLQFIIVTHEADLASAADRVFKVINKKENGWDVSRVKMNQIE